MIGDMTEITNNKVKEAIAKYKEARKFLMDALTNIVRENEKPITVTTFDMYGDELHTYDLKMEDNEAVCCTDDDCNFHHLGILETQELYDIICYI